MWSCLIGMSRVTGDDCPDSLYTPMSGVSLEGVLECPLELGLKEEPDCLEMRPPSTVSSCSSMLNDGIGGCDAAPGMDLRRKELLERKELRRSVVSSAS